MHDLEKERQSLNEDKAQVDKYKQLLLKQRDIMIALTTRLNERDETIIQLQEELNNLEKLGAEVEKNPNPYARLGGMIGSIAASIAGGRTANKVREELKKVFAKKGLKQVGVAKKNWMKKCSVVVSMEMKTFWLLSL